MGARCGFIVLIKLGLAYERHIILLFIVGNVGRTMKEADRPTT